MSRIALDNVAKVYPGPTRPVAALAGLSLHAHEGEYVTVLGPSGCGKTTMLRLIAGLEKPTDGTIRIDGQDASRLPPSRRGVGMVFQSYALYPHLTVRENLAFAARAPGASRAETRRRIDEAARSLGLEGLLNRTPDRLSGGERQRAALARCLVKRPRTMLLDEPLSNLDGPLRAAARADLRSLHRRIGGTTLHVTHEQEEALSLGDRVAVMSAGRLQQTGTPAEVYDRPVNRFVAAFVGSPPMNFLEGRLERRDGLAFVEPGGLRLPIPARLAARFEAGVGRPVVLGIRPAALRERSSGPAEDEAALPITVASVETLGDVTDVSGRTPGGSLIVARLPRRERPAIEPVLTLRLDLSDAHLFEPGDFGRRLTRDGEA